MRPCQLLLEAHFEARAISEVCAHSGYSSVCDICAQNSLPAQNGARDESGAKRALFLYISVFCCAHGAKLYANSICRRYRTPLLWQEVQLTSQNTMRAARTQLTEIDPVSVLDFVFASFSFSTFPSHAAGRAWIIHFGGREHNIRADDYPQRSTQSKSAAANEYSRAAM